MTVLDKDAFLFVIINLLSKPIFILKGRNVERRLPFDYDSYIYLAHRSSPELQNKLIKKFETYRLKYSLHEDITTKIVSTTLKPLFDSKTDQLEVALEKLKKTVKDRESNIHTFLDSWKKSPRQTLLSLERGMVLDIITRCQINVEAGASELNLVKKINSYLIEKIAAEKSLYIAYQGKHAIAEMLTSKYVKRKNKQKISRKEWGSAP